jgi:hypothetical protein
VKLVQEAFGDVHRVSSVGQILEQDRAFVAPETCRGA